MSNVFCGVGDIPKKKKRGSMKECAELGQVRYYGIKKVDEKLINGIINKKKESKKNDKKQNIIRGKNKYEDALLELSSMQGRRKRFMREIDESDDKKEQQKLKKELKKVELRIEELKKDVTKFKSQLKRISRTKKSTKRKSTKRKSTKKIN